MKPAPLPAPLPLCALLISFSGALNITVPSEPVQGLVGDSVLLPVTYSLAQPPTILQVTWSHDNSIVLFSEMTMCGTEAPQTLRICNEYHIEMGRYRHRVVFYPENASLLLRGVQRNDSGRYTVTFQELDQSRSVMLVVQDPEAISSDPDLIYSHNEDDDDGRRVIRSLAVRGMCAAIFILLVMGLHCTWWRQVRKYQTEIV